MGLTHIIPLTTFAKNKIHSQQDLLLSTVLELLLLLLVVKLVLLEHVQQLKMDIIFSTINQQPVYHNVELVLI